MGNCSVQIMYQMSERHVAANAAMADSVGNCSVHTCKVLRQITAHWIDVCFYDLICYALFHFHIKAPSSLARLRLLNILFVCFRRLNPHHLECISDLKLELDKPE